MSTETTAGAAPAYNWLPYYKLAGKRSSPTLGAALSLPDLFIPGRENFACDLGSGQGRDSLALLAQGWHVVAIDNCPAGMARLKELAGKRALTSRLTTVEESFVTASWRPVDLISAHLSLPYCPPASFNSLWQRIVQSLRAGGILSIQLFAERHSAARLPFVTTVTRARLNELLAPFEIIKLDEIEKSGSSATGEPANIHQFQILARKRSGV